MGAKAKKSLKKKMSKISSSTSTQLVNGKQAAADFLVCFLIFFFLHQIFCFFS
jgi:hypothetical protein